MTLAIKKTEKREVQTQYRGRALMVEVGPYSAIIHEKGRQRAIAVPWDAIYDLGMKLQARKDLAERAAEGKVKAPR